MIHRRAPVLAAALIALAACGTSSGAAPTTTVVTIATIVPVTPAPPTTATTSPPTTSPPTTATTLAPTTTVAETTTTVAPTTTMPEAPRMPLTGMPLGAGEVPPDHAALVVKIDNVGSARPQTGLNHADLVFEEIVEGDYTRFAAVFHSQGANPVGPIRSGRTQDIDLLSGLANPIFVWSGGNGRVVEAMSHSGFVLVNATEGGCCFFRSHDRPAPHNLYNNTDSVWQNYGGVAAGRPGSIFAYVAPGAAVPGVPAAEAEVRMGDNAVRWEWAPDPGVYLRRQNGAAHQLVDGQASADNVVILEVAYRPSAADARSPEAVTIGSGRAWVLSDGVVQTGGWVREASTAPFTFVADDGTPILLGPGRTWVELSRAGDNAVQVG